MKACRCRACVERESVEIALHVRRRRKTRLNERNIQLGNADKSKNKSANVDFH